MKPRSFLSAVVLLLVALAVGTSAASAEKPSTAPMPVADITLIGACPFGVLLHPLQVDETFRFYSDGRYAITGVAKLEATNLSTQRSIVVNASGPGQVRPAADGGQVGTLEGLFLNWGFAPDPFLEVTAGLITVEYAADGSVTSITYASNHVRDLCAELAA